MDRLIDQYFKSFTIEKNEIVTHIAKEVNNLYFLIKILLNEE